MGYLSRVNVSPYCDSQLTACQDQLYPKQSRLIKNLNKHNIGADKMENSTMAKYLEYV